MKNKEGKLTSRSLAELIVDALAEAGVIVKENIAKAVEIATQEIEVRKALGDY